MPNVCLASSTIFSSVLAQPSLRWINITPARCGGVRQLCSSGWRWQGSGREAPVPCWGWLEWAHSLSCAWVWPSPCGSKETSPLFQALSVCLACLSLSHHPCMSISLSVCMYVCMYVSLSLSSCLLPSCDLPEDSRSVKWDEDSSHGHTGRPAAETQLLRSRWHVCAFSPRPGSICWDVICPSNGAEVIAGGWHIVQMAAFPKYLCCYQTPCRHLTPDLIYTVVKNDFKCTATSLTISIA